MEGNFSGFLNNVELCDRSPGTPGLLLILIESTCVVIKNVTNLLPVMEKCDITAIQGRKKCKDKADKVGKSAETMLE